MATLYVFSLTWQNIYTYICHIFHFSRRTRRQASLKTPDDASPFGNPDSIEENFLKIEKNSKMPQLQCDIKGRSDVHLEEHIYSESRVSSNGEKVEKRHQEAHDNSENFITKKLGNSNFDALKRGLKRGTDDSVLPDVLTKRPTTCGNFTNALGDGKMPIILDVFTLSQVPVGKNKTNTIRENNFPVTPPCSPPLIKLGIENNDFCERNTVQSFSGTSVAKQSFNVPAKVSGVHNIYRTTFPHDRQIANNGFPIAMNHMYQTNCTVGDKARECYNASHGVPIQTFTDNMLPSASKFAPQGVMLGERRLISECSRVEKGQNIFNVDVPSDRCVYSKPLQGADGNNFSWHKSLELKQRDFKQIERKRLQNSKSIVGFSDRMGERLKDHEIVSVHNSNILPEDTLTGRPRDAVPQSMDGCKISGANKSNGFLSPREIKVLELKKRLKEQEALLNKLRKNH